MGLYRENGQRITKAAFPAAAVADPPKHITEDVYQSQPYGLGDGAPEGSRRHLLYQAGTVVLQSEIDRLFTVAAIATVSPAIVTAARSASAAAARTSGSSPS
ncbi:hypothetical protein [Streptomyces sp. NPDC056982]|uniref:hypothetical protein n=1 Tax=Streptomyces sp. NPDC056982 TaxID=3345986 RepID=UPI00362C337A